MTIRFESAALDRDRVGHWCQIGWRNLVERDGVQCSCNVSRYSDGEIFRKGRVNQDLVRLFSGLVIDADRDGMR